MIISLCNIGPREVSIRSGADRIAIVPSSVTRDFECRDLTSLCHFITP